MPTTKTLVNPVALERCLVHLDEVDLPILDLSFLRVVVAADSQVTVPEGPFPLRIGLQGVMEFAPLVHLQARGEGWIRFGFEKMVPSARAHLRSFLTPRKIGESLFQDWRVGDMHHFHGLNESELWCEATGGVLFTYMDSLDTDAQFMIRMTHCKSGLVAGKILRKHYIELEAIDGELPLIPLSDGDIYTRLGECRDIVTNFRSSRNLEYDLKQRILRVISEYLYSTSRKVELAQMSARKSISFTNSSSQHSS